MLHAEGLADGAEADVPKVEPILAEGGLMRNGAPVLQYLENPFEVKRGHLQRGRESYQISHGNSK